MRLFYVVFFYTTNDNQGISNAVVKTKEKINNINVVIRIESQLAEENGYLNVKLINWKPFKNVYK